MTLRFRSQSNCSALDRSRSAGTSGGGPRAAGRPGWGRWAGKACVKTSNTAIRRELLDIAPGTFVLESKQLRVSRLRVHYFQPESCLHSAQQTVVYRQLSQREEITGDRDRGHSA